MHRLWKAHEISTSIRCKNVWIKVVGLVVVTEQVASMLYMASLELLEVKANLAPLWSS